VLLPPAQASAAAGAAFCCRPAQASAAACRHAPNYPLMIRTPDWKFSSVLPMFRVLAHWRLSPKFAGDLRQQHDPEKWVPVFRSRSCCA